MYSKYRPNIENESTDAISFLILFLPKNCQYVCDHTNLYANQVIGAAPRPVMKYSLVHTWVPGTVSELKKFLGLMFVTGLMNKPNLKLYYT